MRLVFSLSILAVLWCSPVSAQQTTRTKEEIPGKVLKPFLWKLNTKTPNYIFGTIHVADHRALKLHPAVEKAFENADAVLCEIAFTRTAEMQQTLALRMPDGESLSDYLSDELIARIDKRLKPHVAMFGATSPLQLRNTLQFRPVAWPLLLPQLEALKRFKSAPLDKQLYRRAARANKKVSGIEDAKSQLAKLFELTKEEQQEFVRASLDAMDEADARGDDNLMTTIGHYLRGDAGAFHAYFMQDLSAGGMPKSLQKKFLDGLLYSRNRKMATKIKAIVAAEPDQSHFFAIGTAHMLGDQKSVLTYLQGLGIQASRTE